MKKLFTIVILTVIASAVSAQCAHQHKGQWRSMNVYDDPGNARSDSFDIVFTTIDLDMTMMNQGLIKGACTHNIIPQETGLDEIIFDLAEQLEVDSVHVNGALNDFTRSSFHLHIPLALLLQTTTPFDVTIFYRGDPPNDNTFGGFYTVSGYAYNLGVGFNTNPHNFGRAWYPCFDSFVERAGHTIHVLTNNGRTAYCGGLRTSVESVGQDSLRTTWTLTEPIPSYLVSVAVSNYTEVNWTYEKLNGEELPVMLAARAQDTTAFKNSMQTLLSWLQGCEETFGEYRWPRAGYVAVPFNGGAMEHATNIAYPLFAIDGTLNYETLMAHELAHHWWGDLVTCSTAEDMWLNEGWASYCEALYIEYMYGRQAYLDYVMANHKSVLTSAHISDGGRYPVSGVPHELVYGAHVYNKGASILHNIRSMMGDDAFFTASRDFLEAYAFQPVSSEDMKQFFQGYTTLDLDIIFEQWVYSPGYPEFRFKEINTNDTGTLITVEQYGHYSDQTYVGFELPIRVESYGGSTLGVQETSIAISDQTNELENAFEWDAFSTISILNANNAILNAVLPEQRSIYNTGVHSFNYAEATLTVNDMTTDSLNVRIENHWAPASLPNAIPFTDIVVSNDRWWSVQCGQFTSSPSLQLTLRFFGNPTSSTNYDPLFFAPLFNSTFTENDLKIFYRANGAQPWAVWEDALIEPLGSATNWNGRVQIFNVMPGDYCWGIQTGIINTEESIPNVHSVSVYSTPSKLLHMITENHKGQFTIYDMMGKQVEQLHVIQRHSTVNMENWAAGTYLVVYSYNDSVQTYHITNH